MSTSDGDTEVCGYERPNGELCQNPPTEGNSCWIAEHGGSVENLGRPSTLEDHRDDILTGAREGMTIEGCARIDGVDESTLHRWIDKYEEFCKSLKRARAQGERKHLQSVNDPGSRFILERSFGYVKTEKREISGEGGGPISVSLNETIVETPHGDNHDTYGGGGQ